jgi:hypothetical protein
MDPKMEEELHFHIMDLYILNFRPALVRRLIYEVGEAPQYKSSHVKDKPSHHPNSLTYDTMNFGPWKENKFGNMFVPHLQKTSSCV